MQNLLQENQNFNPFTSSDSGNIEMERKKIPSYLKGLTIHMMKAKKGHAEELTCIRNQEEVSLYSIRALYFGRHICSGVYV